MLYIIYTCTHAVLIITLASLCSCSCSNYTEATLVSVSFGPARYKTNRNQCGFGVLVSDLQCYRVPVLLIFPCKVLYMYIHMHIHTYIHRKVLFGSFTLTSYSLPEHHKTLRPPFHCTAAFSGLVQPDSEPCVLDPDAANVHEIKANE